MDLVFVLKWIKSVIGCALYIFHLSDLYSLKIDASNVYLQLVKKWASPDLFIIYFRSFQANIKILIFNVKKC